MIAAVYGRKSTDQSGVSDEQRSVARQVEHARAYAASKGWQVLMSTSISTTASAAPSLNGGRAFRSFALLFARARHFRS
jgi:DNA invertase Pin-like site-specific DNA recombinase